MKPPLLYLVHRIPYPPNKGDKVRSYNILRHLVRHHRVFLGTFVDEPGDWQYVGKLQALCEDVCVIDVEPFFSRLKSLRGVFLGEALSLSYYRNSQLKAWVEDVVAQNSIRTGVVFSGPMAQYLDVPGLVTRVVDFCDLDSAKWTRYAQDHNWPLSWLYRREGEKLLKFESQAALNSQSAIFVTEAEANLFRQAAPGAVDRVSVMQNGVDADLFSPTHHFAPPFDVENPVILFTGAMDYWPNIDAVCWFAKEIFPLIRQFVPNARFWIVGMNPSEMVRNLACESVVVTGTVPDVRPYLAHANVVVAPLRIARGIQNKVLEAMAMSRAVVLSTAPSLGLGAESGRNCMIARDELTFAENVTALLVQKDACVRMGVEAREFVLQEYSWDAHLSLLDRLVTDNRSFEVLSLEPTKTGSASVETGG